MDSRVATRYAKALFSAALKEKALDEVERDLTAFAQRLGKDSKLQTFLANPQVPRTDKDALLVGAYQGRMHELVLGTLRLMLSKRREAEYGEMQRQFVRLRREHERVLAITICSAAPLSDEHHQAIVTKLRTAIGRPVESKVVVDPSLIGGVKIVSENYVLDATVVGGLARLREKLVYDLLKQTG